MHPSVSSSLLREYPSRRYEECGGAYTLSPVFPLSAWRRVR